MFSSFLFTMVLQMFPVFLMVFLKIKNMYWNDTIFQIRKVTYINLTNNY